jgi:hypothetical protein
MPTPWASSEEVNAVDHGLMPSACRDRANAWARSEGFTKDQLVEFDHLMSMVSSTHINKSKLANVSAIYRCSSALPRTKSIGALR